jgi:hypothetical protein
MLDLITPFVVSPFFHDFGSCLALVSRRRTFFDFAHLVHVTPSWRGTQKGLFRRVLSELLSRELLGVVLVFRWDVKLLRVIPMFLVSCCMGLRVPWLRVFLRLLSLIFSCSTRPAPAYMCPMLLFVVWHDVYDLLSICSIFL